MAALCIPRVIFSHTPARFFLPGNKHHKFTFSSLTAPGNYSPVKRAVKIEAAAKSPRPETVTWQKELANTVHLIGSIGKHVQMKLTTTGKKFAWTGLGVNLSPNSTEYTWFTLCFWEEMAEIATEHVKERDRVHVSGQLNISEVTDKDNNPRTYFKVVVRLLNFVEDEPSISLHEGVNMNSAISGSLQGDVNRKPFISGSKTQTKALEVEKLWQVFFVNPTEWWDDRKNKKNPKGPDFKHKSTGEALWIESYYTPSWVKSQLDKLDKAMKFSQQLTKPERSLSSFEDRDFHLF